MSVFTHTHYDNTIDVFFYNNIQYVHEFLSMRINIYVPNSSCFGHPGDRQVCLNLHPIGGIIQSQLQFGGVYPSRNLATD